MLKSVKRKRSISMIMVMGLLLAALFFWPPLVVQDWVRSLQQSSLPLVAIANYGPHASLEETIAGLKGALAAEGYTEGQRLRFVSKDVGFDTALIPAMIAALKSERPAVMVVLSTPVAQYAKGAIQHIPLIFAAVTDPVSAGLLTHQEQAHKNMSGAAEQQDAGVVLNFIRQVIPSAQRVGMLISSADANDAALLSSMQKAAADRGMRIMALSIDHARDIPLRMPLFQDQVDALYIGMSGLVQPALPVITQKALKMRLPVFNAHLQAAQDNQVLGAVGVSYYQVGWNAGEMVAKILSGQKVQELKPVYPSIADHHRYLSLENARVLELILPPDILPRSS